MNKIVNHTESYITGNNITIPNKDIWNVDLDLEELGDEYVYQPNAYKSSLLLTVNYKEE